MTDATIIGRVAVKVIPDTEEFRPDAQRKLNAAEKLLKDVKVSFEADVQQAVDEVRDAVKEAQRRAGHIDIKFDVDNGSKAKVQAQLAVLSRTRTVQIAPVMNEVALAKVGATLGALSGARAVKNSLKAYSDWFRDLDQAVPKIAAVSLAVTNLASTLLTATSNTLAFGGSVAQIGGAALALPGILGGLAIGFGSSFAVLKDFNKILPEVGNKLSALQDSMSVKFWKIAEAPFRSFIDTILPQFSAGLDDSATSLGRFFSKLAGSAEGAFNGQLGSMFADLNKSIQVSSRYTDDFMGVLQKLGAVGAGNLPRLAKWFGDITREFDGWLKKKGPDGLQGFVDTGVSALMDLGGVLRYTGSTFAGLARAAEAAGGSTLAIMRDTMKGVAKVVNGASFQKSLTNAFRGAHEGMSAIAQRSGPQFQSFMGRLSNTLGDVLPSAGRAAGTALGAIFDALDQPAVQSAAVRLFESLETSIDNLAPALPGVGLALASIADVIGELAKSISGSLGPALENLAPAVADVAAILTPLIKFLGGALSLALDALTTVIAAVPAPMLLVVVGAVALKLAMTKLSTSFATLRGAIASTTMPFAGLRANIATVASTMMTAGATTQREAARMSTALRGIGKSALAAGGLMAGLALVSTEAGQSTGFTNAAMYGLMGSMLGPWGAAIGVGVGAVMDFTQANDAAEDAVKALDDALQGNDYSALTAKLAALDTEIQGVEKSASRWSVVIGSIPIVGSAAGALNDHYWTGQVEGLSAASSEAERAKTAYEQLAISMGAGTTGISTSLFSTLIVDAKDLEVAMSQALPALDDLGYSAEKIAALDPAGLSKMNTEVLAWLKHADSGAGRTEALSESLRGLNDTAVSTAVSADSLNKALDELLSPALNAEEATDAWRTSLMGLSEAMKSTAGFRGFGEIALANREASRAYVQDTMTMLTARAENGASTARITGLIRESRSAFIAEGIAAGFTADQMRARANQIGLTPKLVKTVFELTGAERSKRELNLLKRLLGDLPKKLQTIVKSEGVPQTMAEVKALKKRYDLTPKQVSTIVKVLKVEETKKAVKDTMVDVENFAKTKGEAMLGVKDQATAPLEKVRKNLGDYAKVTVKATVDLVDHATSALNAIRANLRSLDGDTATVTTNHRSVYSSGGGGGGDKEGLPRPNGKTVSATSAAGGAVATAKHVAVKVLEAFLKTLDRKMSKLRALADKRMEDMGKAAKRSLRNQLSEINSMSKAYQHQMVALQKLQDKLKALRAEAAAYRQSVIDQVKATGDPTRDGASSYDAIKNIMEIARDEAIAFAQVMAELKDANLNQDTMAALIARGPEEALAAAQAILASGAAGVQAINEIQADINSAAEDLGSTASTSMFGAQIAQAQADIQKLATQIKPLQKKLERLLENLMAALARKVREGNKKLGKELGKVGDLPKPGGDGGGPKKAPKPSAGPGVGNGRPGPGGGSVSVLNYYAQAGPSLTSEEALFAASKRGRMAFN